MEEMVSSDALEKEILDDARKKGERLLKEADAEMGRIRTEYLERARASLESLSRDFASRSERYHDENTSRLPLEKGRMKAMFVDRLLQNATTKYLSSLSPAEVAALVSEMLEGAAGLLVGAEVKLHCKGIRPEDASSLFAKAVPGARVTVATVDDGLPGIGIVVICPAARMTVRATLNLVGERLLDEGRGELAQALCAEALAI